MSIEATISSALESLVSNRVFPDVAPEGTERPYIVYQEVGGQDVNDLEGPANLENARMQIGVWADTRALASSTMRAAFRALTAESIKAIPIGGRVSVYEKDTKLYGSRRDFSIWFVP